MWNFFVNLSSRRYQQLIIIFVMEYKLFVEVVNKKEKYKSNPVILKWD